MYLLWSVDYNKSNENLGVQRAAVRVIGDVLMITEYVRDVLHWLPFEHRIHYY